MSIKFCITLTTIPSRIETIEKTLEKIEKSNTSKNESARSFIDVQSDNRNGK